METKAKTVVAGKRYKHKYGECYVEVIAIALDVNSANAAIVYTYTDDPAKFAYYEPVGQFMRRFYV